MKALLRDLLDCGYRMTHVTAVRREYGSRAVLAATRAGYATIVHDTLYLTPDGVDYIWRD